MAITKVIKSSIDSNTVFRIRQEVRPDEHTVGITNVYYTDSSYANTANTTISSNANSYIKLFGFGFQQNANVVLVPSQNDYLYSSDGMTFFENAIEVNSYYVNWGEYRAQINQNSANTFPISTKYDLFLVNPDGSNASVLNGLNYSNPNIFYGWTIGGHPDTTTNISSIYRYDFSNETFQQVNNLNQSEGRVTTITNSIFGWMIGGVTNPTQTSTSNIERMNLFSDTNILLPRNNLSKLIGAASSAKTKEYGYIIGGYSDTDSGSIYGSTCRLDLYNDSIIISDRAVFATTPTAETASVQNSTHFWIHGGMFSVSPVTFSTNVSRLSFSSDTSLLEQRVTIATGRARNAGVYDTTYGWFGGGQTSTPAIISLVDRLTFSSDTSALSSRGSLSVARQYLSATQDSTYGWFFGGATNPISAFSTVDRITFASDTGTASARGNYPRSAYGTSGMSNYQV
jgi:hypothetical protein